MSVLAEATKIVDGARRAAYGTPQENHTRTAEMWSTYLGVKVTARQVCMLNILQKISRDAHAATHDNLVDIAGYARNAELVEPMSDTAAALEPEREYIVWVQGAGEVGWCRHAIREADLPVSELYGWRVWLRDEASRFTLVEAYAVAQSIMQRRPGFFAGVVRRDEVTSPGRPELRRR